MNNLFLLLQTCAYATLIICSQLFIDYLGLSNIENHDYDPLLYSDDLLAKNQFIFFYIMCSQISNL